MREALTGESVDGGKRMGGTIICGVSDSDGSRAAAEVAAALAARLCSRLVLVHVAVEWHARDECALEAMASGLGGVEVRIVRGARVDGIARVAAEEGADAIVVGSRLCGASSRRLRCSLVHDLEAATSVPVVIAPPATRARSARRLALATVPVRQN